MLRLMISSARQGGRTMPLVAAGLATLVAATVLATVATPATARSRAGVRVAVANVASLSDIGTAASIVAAGGADAVLFARTAAGLGPESALLTAQHRPASAVLVGGKAALGNDIETELRGLSPDVEVSRLAGSDRIDTAARAARQSSPASSELTAVIANGWSLPDVGTAASIVATGGGDVVLYSDRDRLSAATRDSIAHLRPARIVIVGGPAAVAPAVVTELAAAAPGAATTRRHGATRIETATEAAGPAFDAGATHAIVANGWSDRDVGIAAALAASDTSAAVLYTDRRGRLTGAVAAVISQRRPTLVTLVGDGSVLPASLVDEIAARSAGTRTERLEELECPATVSEATARAALLADQPDGASPTGSPTDALTVAIESCAPHYADGAFVARFTFSDLLDDFDDSDIYVVNGEVRHLVGSDARYRAVIAPAAPGAVLVRIPHGAVRSTDGIRNSASAPFVRVHAVNSGLPAAGLDTWNRPVVLQAYNNEFERSEPDSGYTGNLGECAEGTTSDEFRDSVVQRASWYRAMAGLDAITEAPELSKGAQATALMMLAESRLSHYPDVDWACYSETGAAIAAASNLGLGNAGVSGIDAYMRDSGDNNLPVGHRRWILYPQLLEAGTGNAWHPRSRYRRANALDIISGELRRGNVPIRAARGSVSWPPAGFVPAGVVWGRWSFSLAGADFENAEVGMVDESGSVATRILERGPGAGDPAIVWAVAGDKNSNLIQAPRDGDRCYTVTIDGVTVDGNEQPPYEYPVCVIDPRAPTGPTVSLDSDASSSVGSEFEISITFDDPVDGFTRHDIDIHNGSVTKFTGAGRSYAATIRAHDNGEVVASVRTGAVHDARNRPSAPSAPLVRTADVGRPVATLSSTTGATVSGSFDVSISFNEAVTGLDLSDIRVVNGTAADLRGSGSSYQATISPAADGTVMVRVSQDAATNDDGRANAASQPLTRLRSAGGRASGIGLDSWDRSGVVRSYLDEFGRDEPDAGFTGDVSACEPGTTSDEYRSGVVQRFNWYRAAAGLGEVSENAAHTVIAQHATLMHLANEQYTLSQDAKCFTAEAERISRNALGLLGRTGAAAVDIAVRSDLRHNLRRNVLTPHLGQIGVGHTSNPDSPYRVSFMLYMDYGDAWNAARPRVREARGFVAWPPAGFVADDLVPRKWSFSLSNADYSGADVTVADHVGTLPVTVVSQDDWFREHSLTWAVDISAAGVRARRPTDADHCFTVRLDGVRVSGVTQQPFEYAVCVVNTAE